LQSFACILDNGGSISGTKGKFLFLPDDENSLIRDGLVEVIVEDAQAPTRPESTPKKGK